MTQDFKEDKLNIHLENLNSLERVRELVQTRLVDCGWRDQVRLACRKAIVENTDENGDHRVPTVDELINIVTPKARSLVPDSVKRELLHELELLLVKADNAGQHKKNL